MKRFQHVVWLGKAQCEPLRERVSQYLYKDVAVAPGRSVNEAEAVITACVNEAELRTLVLGSGGLLREKRAGLVYIDISWIGEDLSKEIAAAADAVGALYLRAPITRGPVGSQELAYTAMVSGRQAAFDSARSLLECLAEKIVFLGEGEEARAMTGVLDVMTGVSLGMWAEALVFGEAAGLNWKEMVQVMETSAIASPLIKEHAERVSVHQYESSLTCAVMLERLEAALAKGKSTGAVLLLAGIAHQMYLGAVGSGAKDSGSTAIIPWLEAAAGIRPVN